MAINLNLQLPPALASIGYRGKRLDFPLPLPSKEPIAEYGNAKWAIVDLLNKEYTPLLQNPFDLHHWINHEEDDEVAYFLNEAGSNTLNYAEQRFPSAFRCWLGELGFIIAIEQAGQGFAAEKINREKIKENEGAAFSFYRRCRATIFFDDPHNARVVYFKYTFL